MKKITLAIMAAMCTLASYGQNGINSPYSRYGFGIQSERALGFNKGMGGVAQGFRDGQQINIANPASYSAVDSLTALFDIGISLQNGNYKMGSLRQNVRNSSFDYFAFQFRAFKNVGMTLGIMPITNIKYSFHSTSETVEGTENITSSYNFNGDGGLREVFLGVGWRPFRPISIGVNARYIWGEYTHNASMSFSQSTAYSMVRVYNGELSTYSIQAGLQYIQPIGKKDQLVIGATYTLGHDTDNNRAFRTTSTTNGTTIEESTSDTIRNPFQLPHVISAGATYYHANKLRIGADFELQKWSDCKFPNQQTDLTSNKGDYVSTKNQLYDRTKIAAGLDWTPNPISSRYFNRCTYKVGGYFAQTYAKADLTGTVTDKPYEFGVSAGLSLPIANKNAWRVRPKVNLAVQWVHTNIPYLNASTLRQSTLKEDYLRLCIGVTFSERWFYKFRVE